MADLGNGTFTPAPGTTYWSKPIGTKTYSSGPNGSLPATSYPVGPNQSFNNAPYVNPITVGYPQPAGGGTGGGGGGSTPSAPSQPAAPDPFQQALNSSFDAENNYLNQAQSTLQNAQGGITQGINQGFDTSRTNLTTSNQQGVAQIDQSTQQGEQRHQDALIAARRLYNELMMGGQQRFGGASSAGEAYGALTGRELQRNNQQTNTDYSAFMGQVTTAKANLQTQFDNGLRTLEQQRQDSLKQAERDYQDKLLSIQHDKASAASAKAQSQLSLLQQLRNNVYQINLAQAQNTSTLQQAHTQAQAQYDQYVQSMNQNVGNANQAGQAFNQNTNVNPQSALTTGGGTQQQAPNMTGQIASAQGPRDQFGNLLYPTA